MSCWYKYYSWTNYNDKTKPKKTTFKINRSISRSKWKKKCPKFSFFNNNGTIIIITTKKLIDKRLVSQVYRNRFLFDKQIIYIIFKCKWQMKKKTKFSIKQNLQHFGKVFVLKKTNHSLSQIFFIIYKW